MYGKVEETKSYGIRFKESESGHYPKLFCMRCWGRVRGRDAAAYYTPDDADQLWAVLTAANGTLVADLKALTIGGRGWVRIVDGAVEARHSVREKGDDGVIRFTTEPSEEFTRERFDELLDQPRDRRLVLLRPVSETPFADTEES
jgi:hypothetical protein